MPTIDISALGNILLIGMAVTFAFVWVFIQMSAQRDLRGTSYRKPT